MPNNYIKYIADNTSLSVKELEKIWEEAVSIVSKDKKKYKGGGFYAVVTTVFKSILKPQLTKSELESIELKEDLESTHKVLSFKEYLWVIES